MATSTTCDHCGKEIEDGIDRIYLVAGTFGTDPVLGDDGQPVFPASDKLPAMGPSVMGLTPKTGTTADLHIECWEKMTKKAN